MSASADTTPSRRWLWLAVVGIAPALILAAIGVFALRRERAIAWIETQEAARSQARDALDALAATLLAPPLPSRADVEAFRDSGSGPKDEPLTWIAAQGDDTLALLIVGPDTYPGLGPAPSPPPSLDRFTLPEAVQSSWRLAEANDGRRQTPHATASERWHALVEEAGSGPWAPLAQLRLGQALLREGRTVAARDRLEPLAVGDPGRTTISGESGLPLDVLALRALLKMADLDAEIRPRRGPWLDLLAQRVLLHWRLPPVVLADWEITDPERLDAWGHVAAHHARVRTTFETLRTFLPLDLSVTNLPRWLPLSTPPHPHPNPNPNPPFSPPSSSSSTFLLTSHETGGGTWLLLRSSARLQAAATRVLAARNLPSHVTATVRLAGQDLLPSTSDAFELAVADFESGPPDLLRVALHLTDRTSLEARWRSRTVALALLIAAATVTTIAGFLVTLRAYERQRRYSELQANFVASVSHELRAPLAAIRLMAEELSDLPEEARVSRSEYHRLILRESSRLGRLIENVLRHARWKHRDQDLDRAPVDLVAVIQASVEALRPCATEREVDLRIQLPNTPIVIQADAQAIQQVLTNLLDNALKHSPRATTVTVRLASASPDAVRISVEDQGGGIPPEEQARIFDEFYRRGSELRRETAGVGLGLAIVKRLVDAHGGRVHVRSQPGAGACFAVELPASDQLPATGSPAPAARPGGGARQDLATSSSGPDDHSDPPCPPPNPRNPSSAS